MGCQAESPQRGQGAAQRDITLGDGGQTAAGECRAGQAHGPVGGCERGVADRGRGAEADALSTRCGEVLADVENAVEIDLALRTDVRITISGDATHPGDIALRGGGQCALHGQCSVVGEVSLGRRDCAASQGLHLALQRHRLALDIEVRTE